jgi:spore germination protein GerM
MTTTRRPYRSVVTFAVGIAAAVTLAACGVPTESTARPLPLSVTDPGLLNPVDTTTTTPTSYVTETIFLVGPTGKLVAVQRAIPVPARLSAIIDELAAEPTEAEAQRGYFSAVPPGTTVQGPIMVTQILAQPSPTSGSVSTTTTPTVIGELATIDLSGAFAFLAGTAQFEAASQVVCTVTTYPNQPRITAVAFQVGGLPLSVTTANGSQMPGPVTPSQFGGCPPLPSSA